MLEIRNVTGTAFVVAEFRAEENAESTPLYQDLVVNLFLTEESRDAAARVAATFPPAKDLIRARTKYLDDMLEHQIQSNIRQVVILGAGLDTRAVRKTAPGVTYFEIDDAETIAEKARCYQQHRFDVSLKLIPGNYVSDGLISLLDANDFDFSLPTYFIWEGNTMYLPLHMVKQVLNDMRRHVQEFVVSFDYLADTVIAKTTGDAGITRLVESFAAMGAPWITGFRDITTLANEVRLNVIENFPTADLFKTYWSGRAMPSPIYQLYSVCTLGL